MQYYEKTLESKEIYKGKIINLRLDKVLLPDGKTSTREIVEHPGAVAVVAITSDNKVLLVQQFRKACEKELWEIPAGKIDPGENPENTAYRELEEETGFKTKKLKKITSFYTSPGFSDEFLYIYLAEELTSTEKSTDEDEFLSVHSKTWEEICEMLKKDMIQDAKTVTGLLLVMAEKGVKF